MTRDQAVGWFWRTCPAGCLIELVVIRPIKLDPGDVRGWAYVDRVSCDLEEFMGICATVADERWQGSLDHDSELVEFVRSAVLSAYGRLDACRVAVVR